LSVRLETIDGVLFILGASASGAVDVSDTLDAGVARLRAAAQDAMSDMPLVSGGELDVLPSSEAARYALTGALADQALSAMQTSAPLTMAYVVSGECGAFFIEGGAALDVPEGFRTTLWYEVVRALQPGAVRGGVAVAGRHVPESGDGDGDAVAIYARSAAEAALSAVLVGDAVKLSEVANRSSTPSPEEVWEALSQGVRTLLLLRDANIVRGGVLAFRGRGRVVGPGSGDGLLRFGVSDWR